MLSNHPVWTAVAIGIYFAMMLFIGYMAWRRTRNLGDYMLGGRRLPAPVAALSAGAADMSGWLLMGLPGALYAAGLVEAWMSIGLTVGAWCNWYFTAPRLRAYTQVAGDSITIPTFLGNRFRSGSKALRVASGVIILVYFTFYVSSGMVASGKFMLSTFGLDAAWGILIVGGITIAYTLFGGFLGATWTDVVQGLLMLAALVAVPIASIASMGGWGAVMEKIAQVDAASGGVTDHLSWTGAGAGVGVLTIISAVAWGLGYFGQPHILVRFMALRTPKEASFGRRVGIGWMILISLGACLSGLIGAGFFAGRPLADSETVFLAMAQILFPPLIAGFVLAAVLAAIMSTLSSQLVVCSSALVEDLLSVTRRGLSKHGEVIAGRLGVLVVAVVAAILAFTAQSTILQLVAFAWAGFGASFGPVLILSLYWKRLTDRGALAGLITGAVTVFVWKQFFTQIPGAFGQFATNFYEIIPGFALALLAAIAVSLSGKQPSAEVQTEFAQAATYARSGNWETAETH